MNEYNIYYFLKNMKKNINNNSIEPALIVNEMNSFFEENRAYDYLSGFKDLEDKVNQEKDASEIDIDKIRDCIQTLMNDIENQVSNENEDYSYIENKIRNIIFSIK